MRRSVLPWSVALLAVAAAALARTPEEGRTPFPHALHEGLFPTCRPCHEGALTGGDSLLYSVTPDQCAACHDGAVARQVVWAAPRPEPTNVRFAHDHNAGGRIECSECHRVTGEDARMAVTLPKAEQCLGCHGEPTHFDPANRCATCHLPLDEAKDLPAERVAAFPAPPNHGEEEFLARHGELAVRDPERCAVCHARETCETCHPNGGSLEAIRRLPPDPRAALQAERIEARWPRPASHDDPDWITAHGERRETLAACANCHVRESCETCHGARFQAAEALPAYVPGKPFGVRTVRSRPLDHDAGFALGHGTAAAAGGNCASCHARESCQDCHEAMATPGFHGSGFMARHAAEAYSREVDCASCHSTEVFCRDCHAGSGLSPADSRTSAYHDSQPFWLLNHGAAARQGLESCASCHQQTDCLQCHSAKSGLRINPHGPEFAPHALGDRNLAPCSVCHFADPRP